MAFNDIEQIKRLLTDKKQILITFRVDAKGDAIGSAVALFLFLEAYGKRVELVAQDFSLPSAYRFLTDATKIQAGLGHLQKFVLNVDIAKTGIQELSYDIKNQELRIYITPKTGFISKDDIQTAQSDFKYDLIIILDSPDLNSLGALYANNTDFFYRTPIINIANQTNNEHFGQINIVDLTMSTTAEHLYRLMNELRPELITPDIATALLTGLIAGTGSFKKPNVRPQTLAAASELVNLGADRPKIVKNLFQTKSIATFKLWGAALAGLEHDPTLGLVWSTITREDFVRAGARDSDLPAIIDELIASSPAAKFILLLHEHAEPGLQHEIHGLFQTNNGSPNANAKDIMRPFGSTGDGEQSAFRVSGTKTLREIESEVLAHLRQSLGKTG